MVYIKPWLYIMGLTDNGFWSIKLSSDIYNVITDNELMVDNSMVIWQHNDNDMLYSWQWFLVNQII